MLQCLSLHDFKKLPDTEFSTHRYSLFSHFFAYTQTTSKKGSDDRRNKNIQYLWSYIIVHVVNFWRPSFSYYPSLFNFLPVFLQPSLFYLNYPWKKKGKEWKRKETRKMERWDKEEKEGGRRGRERGGERGREERRGAGSIEVRQAEYVRERNGPPENERFWALELYTCVIHADKNSMYLCMLMVILILIKG